MGRRNIGEGESKDVVDNDENYLKLFTPNW